MPPNSLRKARGWPWPTRLSLRARLTWVFALAMAAMLTGLGAFIYLRLGAELLTGVDRNLGAHADALTSTLATDPSVPLGGGHRFVDPDEAFAQILDPTGHILDSTRGAAGGALLTAAQARRITGATFLTRQHPQPDDSDRLLAVPVTVGGRSVIAVVGQSLGDRRDELRHVLALYAIAGPAGLLLTSAAGWILAGATLRPVEAIRRRAEQLSHTEPTGRLPVPGTGDELTRLTVTLNDLLGRMHAAVQREHRFVNDASHELRTPLAVLKAELDLAATRPRTSDELRTTLNSAARETDRLVALAEDLLVLARARQGRTAPRRTSTHLPSLIAEAVAPLQAEAARVAARIGLDVQNISVDVDPDQIRRAVQNLVGNSIRHGGGHITVTALVELRTLRIDVHDCGPGFPECLLPNVFEPFTHGSTPRLETASYQGAGLGLAIVRAIAEAHDGAIVATNPARGGALVSLRLGTGDATPTPVRRCASPT